MTSPTLRRAAALAGSLALLALLPAAASAAGNPQVVRVDPTTGVVKQLAGGAPFTHLGGLAFGPSGTLYVANQGPIGPSPRGAGIYALRPPAYAVASIGSGTAPAAVVASGGTLYSLDSDRIVGIDGTTGAERTVTTAGSTTPHRDGVADDARGTARRARLARTLERGDRRDLRTGPSQLQ